VLAKVEFAFPRKASGLVRELGWWSAFSISISYTVGSGINYYAIRSTAWHPGSNIPLAFIIGALPMIFLAYIYTEMGIMMPRSGGDYIYISRVLDPGVGFMANWLYFVANNFATGLLAVIASRAWGYVIHLAGIITDNAGWIELGSKMMTPGMFQFGIAVTIITIYMLLSLLGVRVFRWYIAAIVAFGFAASFIAIGASFYAASKGTEFVKAAWDATYGAGAWEEIERVAAENGWTYEEYVPWTWDATIGNFVDTFWAYWGATAAVYVGGEMKSPKTGFLAGVFGCAIFLMVFYVVTLVSIMSAYTKAFVSQVCFVMELENVSELLTVMEPLDPSLAVFTAPLVHNIAPLAILFAILPALWITNCSGSTLLVGPRQPFAWAFDRFFPGIFCQVNETFHSPHWSVILTGLIAYTFVPIPIWGGGGLLIAMADVTFIYILRCLFGAITGVVLPYKKPDIWERGFKLSVGGVPVISICGVIACFWWLWGLAISAWWLSFLEMAYLSFWFAFGAFIWFFYAEYNKRRGIPLESIYGTIPPA